MCAGKEKWRQVTSQGESLQAANEGAPQAAPQASEADHQTSAAESAPRAALQAQIADPEPSPQETHKSGKITIFPKHCASKSR